MKSIADREHDKAEQALADMLVYLNAHPLRHTPFMDRWFRLVVDHNQMVYPARPKDGAVNRVVEYGRPKRKVLCIESAAPLGHPGTWFVKVVA